MKWPPPPSTLSQPAKLYHSAPSPSLSPPYNALVLTPQRQPPCSNPRSKRQRPPPSARPHRWHRHRQRSQMPRTSSPRSSNSSSSLQRTLRGLQAGHGQRQRRCTSPQDTETHAQRRTRPLPLPQPHVQRPWRPQATPGTGGRASRSLTGFHASWAGTGAGAMRVRSASR